MIKIPRYAIWILPLILGLSFVNWYEADMRTRPDVRIPLENRDRFVSADILLDLTTSVGNDDVTAKMKSYVTDQLVPRLGIGDIAMCYSVEPKFQTESSIFEMTTDAQPPLPPGGLANTTACLAKNRESSQRGVATDALYDLLSALPALNASQVEVRKKWIQEITDRRRPEGEGSDYIGTLGAIAQNYNNESATADRERWVIVVGDLIDEPRYHRPPGSDLPGNAFNDVKVKLIHPPDASRDWTAIGNRWTNYFRGADVEMLSLDEASHRDLLPPNPLAGMEQRPAGNVALTFLMLWIIEIAIGLVFGWLLGRQRLRQLFAVRAQVRS